MQWKALPDVPIPIGASALGNNNMEAKNVMAALKLNVEAEIVENLKEAKEI